MAKTKGINRQTTLHRKRKIEQIKFNIFHKSWLFIARILSILYILRACLWENHAKFIRFTNCDYLFGIFKLFLLLLTRKLLNQGFVVVNLKSSFRKFYLVNRYRISVSQTTISSRSKVGKSDLYHMCPEG
jgi:hypothetical protein